MKSVSASSPKSAHDRNSLAADFLAVRQQTETLCAPLETEDFVVQTMEDVSPSKWHIGHTSWFFEQVILERFEPGFRKFSEPFFFVFNSYYQSFGDRLVRSHRGTLSRPTVAEVMAYRQNITDRTMNVIHSVPENDWPVVAALVQLGINHEQQHQELFLTDIKHVFASNALRPVYGGDAAPAHEGELDELRFVSFEGGNYKIGHEGGDFAYDNESPRHIVYVSDFRLATRAVTCGEYLDFINDNGYGDHRWWLSDGWDRVQNEGWQAPLYWEREGDGWHILTLRGRRPVDLTEPVCHVSHYEAAAFARWIGMRLPTEAEWEVAAATQKVDDRRGAFQEDRIYHPVGGFIAVDSRSVSELKAMFGNVWEWTSSAYLPYPGYQQSRDALGEYNGKFMNNQIVLRGGSCATPRSHIRPTYRNFFQSEKRWQFSGFRLATDG